MGQAGEYHDKKGVPIYPGDLLKSPHFTERNGRKHYLYHTVVFAQGHLEMVPTSALEPTKANQGGRCRLSQEHASQVEVISGCGPDPYLDHYDRPRVKDRPRPSRTPAPRPGG